MTYLVLFHLKLYVISTRTTRRCILISPGGGEALPYKRDGGARRKISITPLNGTRILFYGRVPNSFTPLRGTNSTTKNVITGTANFNNNKDNFRTLSSQGLS